MGSMANHQTTKNVVDILYGTLAEHTTSLSSIKLPCEQADIINTINHKTALKIAVNILKKWSCSEIQRKRILCIPSAQLMDRNCGKLEDEVILRISILLNIHNTLNSIFNNKKNVYQFMSMRNNNAFFEGRTPLSIIKSGSIESLEQVYQELQKIRFPNFKS